MAFSKSDLVTLTCQYAGYCSAEETPSADDADFVGRIIESELDQMTALNIPIWDGSVFSVPSSYLSLLARRMAYPVGLAIGLWTPDQVEAGIRMIESKIRALSSVRSTGATTHGEYF